jgi:hypothetical protein
VGFQCVTAAVRAVAFTPSLLLLLHAQVRRDVRREIRRVNEGRQEMEHVPGMALPMCEDHKSTTDGPRTGARELRGQTVFSRSHRPAPRPAHHKVGGLVGVEVAPPPPQPAAATPTEPTVDGGSSRADAAAWATSSGSRSRPLRRFGWEYDGQPSDILSGGGVLCVSRSGAPIRTSAADCAWPARACGRVGGLTGFYLCDACSYHNNEGGSNPADVRGGLAEQSVASLCCLWQAVQLRH